MEGVFSMAKKIQLIIGSTRENRVGADVAEWVATHARAHDDIDLEVIDLKEVNLPFFSGPTPPAYAPDTTEAGQAWAKKIAEGEGYIFVTPEYNRGLPAALKNALDYLVAEWENKPALVVSYGFIDGGQSAAKHLHDVLGWLKVSTVESTLSLKLTQDMTKPEGGIKNADEAFSDYEAVIDEALKELVAHEPAPVGA
jgi:NAD(P)H-dependent FMN reductase